MPWMEKDVKKNGVPKYNKREIIDLTVYIEMVTETKSSDPIESTENIGARALEKRIDKIIKFLESNRAQKVLEWSNEPKKDSGDYFLNQEMNINHKLSPDEKKEYEFNLITAITLAILLSLYKHSYFQSLLKNEFASVVEGEDWFCEIEKRMKVLEKYWKKLLKEDIFVEVNGQKQKEERNWPIISVNIRSQLYKLTLPRINEDYIEGIDKKLQEFTDKFLSLDDESKNIAFDKIKTRLEYMNTQLEKVTKDIDYVQRWEYNMNLQSKKGNHGLKGLE